MYSADKIALYLFLLERVHIVRAPFVDRTRDMLYVFGGIFVTGGFLAIMGWQFVSPMAILNHQTGECRIGIERPATIAIIVLDILMNTVLTGIFVWQLRPALGSSAPRIFSLASDTDGTPSGSSVQRLRHWMKGTRQAVSTRNNLRVMLVRNVVGSGFMLFVTLCNNSLFLAWDFAKMSHACLLMCLADICLGMLVTQWLTMRSAEPVISPRASRASLVDESTDSEVSFVNEKPVPISRVLDKARFNLR
ncbi:hypothetical protein J4E91_002542 [Alternaria rosae]|nr:hypothetical protein J4E91_002542 [Alternaria rosae]